MIGDRPLVEYLPLQQKGSDSELVTQYPMGDVEALGLLKMDFLGLRNLDVIDEADPHHPRVRRASISATSRGCRSTTSAPTTCSRAATRSGVFQFESSGMRDALRQVKPTEFEDLIALVALYRPGPMANIPRVREAQERPRDRHLPRPAPRADPAHHAGRLHLPGAGDADRQGPGRLQRPPRPTICARRSPRRCTR